MNKGDVIKTGNPFLDLCNEARAGHPMASIKREAKLLLELPIIYGKNTRDGLEALAFASYKTLNQSLKKSTESNSPQNNDNSK